MAITDMKGTVTTTGKMNNAPDTPKAADLSQMNKLFERRNKPAKVAEQPKQMPVEQPKEMPVDSPQEMGLMEKVQNLTDQDKAVLATVLSPSVSNALKKIAPELTPLLDQAGTTEENVIIPVSMFTSFAVKRYEGDQTEAVNNLITDMSGETMDQSTVPPDTQMAEQSESGVEQEFNAIDTEGEVV